MSTSQEQETYSNAFNFSSFLSGGVDPRTGIYSCTLSLGDIQSHALNGPVVPINLCYNPLNPFDRGFGKGWTLALTRYDRAAKNLALMSGELYKTQELTSTVMLVEQKLQRHKILKTADERFIVSALNGQQEELALFGSSGIAVVRRIVAANGVSIELDHVPFNTQPVLSAVRDKQRTLLAVNRSAGGVELKRYPESDEEASFSVRFANNRIVSITLPGGGRWALSYQIIDGLSYLSRITSPMGAVEHIGYKRAGLRFPVGARRQAMACVATHTVYPGNGQPAIRKDYRFSDKNFLGFSASGISATTAGDALYQALGEYSYTSDEILMSGSQVHSTTRRTYNKFHLLDSQVTQCGQKIKSELFSYHYEPGKPFSEQPAQCCLPKRSVVKFHDTVTGNAHQSVTQLEFDDAGNEVKKVEPSGLTTQTEYYPAEGSEGCPADPLMLVRFAKQKTVSSTTDISAPPRITRYQYAALPVLENASVACIVPISETFLERVQDDEVLQVRKDFDYVIAPQNPDVHGRLASSTSTRNGLATTQAQVYSVNQTTITIDTTVTGHDGCSASSTLICSALTGVTLAVQEEGRARITYEYDALGRLTRETVAKGTPFEAFKTHAYQLPESSTQLAQCVITDAKGLRQRMLYDGIGRVCTIEEEDGESTSNDTTLAVVKTNTYNALGQLQEQTVTDWLAGQPLHMKTEFGYDAWGHVNATCSPDGQQEYVTRDLELLRQTSWKQGFGKTVTQFNVSGKPLVVETFDLHGTRLARTIHGYDGFDRCLHQTDPAGNVTTFEYDVFDRLCKSTLPDASVVETSWALFSHEALPTQIQVANRVLGLQTFDGLGRLKSTSCGGRQSTFDYANGEVLPITLTQPDGSRTTRSYEAQLNGLLTQRTSVDSTSLYTYDATSGLQVGCAEKGRTGAFDYSRAGRLTREQWNLVGRSFESSYSYSLGGRSLAHVDATGQRHTHEYDAFGRLKTLQHDSLKAEFNYNALGQLQAISAIDPAQHRLKTTLAYDDIGREVMRSIHRNDSQTHTLTTRYTATSKVAQRTLTGPDNTLRDEHFSYDARGRLISYRCEGSQRPRDFLGNEILSQRFVFDAWDNVVSLETDFAGGTNTTTYTMSANDPTQLIQIEHSHPDYPTSVTLQYDANGKLILDAHGRTLSYDGLGRLTQVALGVNAALRTYAYDAQDRLVEVASDGAAPACRLYRNGVLSNEIKGVDTATFFRMGEVLLGQSYQGAVVKTVLQGTDTQDTVLAEAAADDFNWMAYTPYGVRTQNHDVLSGLGFNGEMLDLVTGCYVLGNGYRAYDPQLMRFQSPDDQSPFGDGGFNPYAYCLGDPINRSDPTGHSSLHAWLGFGAAVLGVLTSILTFGAATPLAVIGLVAGVGSGVAAVAGLAAEHFAPDSGAGDILGYVSLGLGLLSLGAGAAASAKALQVVGNRLNNAFKAGLSGKGAGKKAAGMARSSKVSEENVTKWKLIKPEPNSRKVKQLSSSARDNYEAFTDAIDKENLHPKLAADRIGDANYSKLRGTQNQFEVRIGGKDRVTFLLRQHSVEILQVGGHS